MFQNNQNNNNSQLQMLLSQFGNNPLFNRAQQMASGKTPQELERVARNLCEQRGINYDDAMKAFQQQFKF
jgi:hypothetical protein